jgi:hypothetical protein
MIQWCQAAGPTNIKTEFALQVFVDVRWSIVCILFRSRAIHPVHAIANLHDIDDTFYR